LLKVLALAERLPGIAHATPPAYPTAAKRAGQTGLVRVCVRVLADGRAEPKGIIRSSLWPALDDAALNTVEAWRFSVATDERGNPVDDYRQVSISFSLTF
jgi:protein TonB